MAQNISLEGVKLVARMNNLILFHADSRLDAGMGHVMRCIALAGELNMPAGFLCQPNGAVQRLVKQAGFLFFPLQDEKGLYDQVKNLSPAAVVADSYGISGEEIEPVKREIPLLIVIDDLNDRYLPADLLINGNITAFDLGYIPDKRLLLGPEYVLLREEFRNCPPKKIVERARKLMVTIGGSDPLDLMPFLLNALSGLNLHIKAVMGPHFKTREKLISIAKRQKSFLNGFLELVESPDMADLMRWADLAVSAGGSTLYELCATGTPAVVLAIADNQVPAARALDKQGCVWYLGFHDEVLGYGFEDLRDVKEESSLKSLAQAVKTLAQDYFRRAEMSRRGRVLVDGLGTKRCAAVIREISYSEEIL